MREPRVAVAPAEVLRSLTGLGRYGTSEHIAFFAASLQSQEAS
jgi:hypothetical protein